MGAGCHQKWQKHKTVPSWWVGIDRVSVGYPRVANGMNLAQKWMRKLSLALSNPGIRERQVSHEASQRHYQTIQA
jgi:hypothetical protein